MPLFTISSVDAEMKIRTIIFPLIDLNQYRD